MINVISVSNMRLSDATTINKKISAKDLMYKAGVAIYNSYKFSGNVLIVCGSGNNAGDGYVLASLLSKDGANVTVYVIKNKFSEDAKFYFDKLKNVKILIEEKPNFSDYDIIVDAIFGTGFKGDVISPYKEIIEDINNTIAYVISIDINSGLNGDSGMGTSIIKSNLTISIGTYKTGHFLNMAKDYIDNLINVDIGIDIIDKPYHLIEASDLKNTLYERKNFSNKGDYGYVSLIGGSINYSGAIRLASLANRAVYSGAGVVMLAIPKELAKIEIPEILESTIYPLESEDGFIKYNPLELDYLMKRCKTITIGMGLGDNKSTYDITKYLLENYDKTLIMDADSLNALSKMDDEVLLNTKAKVIITPHIKEFSRLIKKDIINILDNEIEYAINYAKKYHLILLLKGTSTIVTDGAEVYIVKEGSSGMAKGGSGDVLSGVLSAITAYNTDKLIEATYTSAYINGLAGMLAKDMKTSITTTPKDTINCLKLAIERTVKENGSD